MDTTNTKSKRVQQFYFFLLLLTISIVFSLALAIWVECLLRALALEQHQRTFPSDEQASHTLLEIPAPAACFSTSLTPMSDFIFVTLQVTNRRPRI
jgi:hypothetical protein